MSDINNEVKFNIRNRTFAWNKKDYKDNKKEEFLFNILTSKFFKDAFNLSLLDKGDDDSGIITSKDIQVFLSNKDVKKKNITEEDVISFLNKMMKLNPTEDEKTMEYIETHYTNDEGKHIMTNELKEMLGLEHKFNDINVIKDKNNNVKSGYEIFDLNNDGKIDELEQQYILKSNLVLSDIGDLNNYLSKIENISTDENNGIISSDKKQLLYNQLVDEQKQKLRKELYNSNIKDDNNNLVINDKIKELFNNSDSVPLNNLVDKNGNIKQGYEVFDLNGDGKFDDKEKQYFSSGGKFLDSEHINLTIDNFTNAIKNLDKFGYVPSADNNIENNIITKSDKELLYRNIAGVFNMVENMKDFPQETQQKFIQALKDVNIVQHHTKYSTGAQLGGKISVDAKNMNDDEIATVLIHELTHYILSQTTDMNPLTQEVETFYMEYKLYQNLKTKPDFYDRNHVGNNVIFSNINYLRTVEKLKEMYPNLSEKDIAVTAFMEEIYDSYNGRLGYSSMTEEELKNSKYDDLGGIIKE